MNDIIKETNYYIIEVKGKGRCYYKIGEGSSYRPKELVKKYSKLRDIDAKILYIDVLPHNREKRLNDKTIHKNLSKLNHVDHFIIEGLLHEKDGKNEFFEIPKDYSNINVVNYVKEVVDKLKENPANFKVKNDFIDNIRLVYADGAQKHQVGWDLIKQILIFGNISLNKYINKNILLIGQFLPEWVSTFALYNNVYIWHDSETEKHIYKCDDLNEHITYIKDLKELLEMNKKPDLIIANPPYKLGNEITKTIIDNIDFKDYINLMPVNYYKTDIYKHVESLQLVDPKLFTDAKITDNLTIAKISKDELNKNWEDVELATFNLEYTEFYKLNHILPRVCSNNYSIPVVKYDGSNVMREKVLNESISKLKKLWMEKRERIFVYTLRAALDGTHNIKGNAYDVIWNIKHEFFNMNYPIGDVGTKKQPAIGLSIFLLEFKTEKECANFTKFFYAGGKNGLMNKLVKGLNKNAGVLNAAIPNIDWGIDRDYEHLTYDELLDIMRDEIDKQ